MTFAQGKLRFYLLIFLVIFLDQITKAKFGTSCNTGIAFGLFKNAGVVSLVVPIIIVAACFSFLLKQKEKTLVFSLALIAGGGMSNVIDRLMMGCVRDFIDLKFWPSFNLADSAVTIGVLILVFGVFLDKSHD